MDKDHLISRRSFIKTASLIGSGFAIGFNFLQAKRRLDSDFSPNTWIDFTHPENINQFVTKFWHKTSWDAVAQRQYLKIGGQIYDYVNGHTNYRVFAHEMGHCFFLDDIYDPQKYPEGQSLVSIMNLSNSISDFDKFLLRLVWKNQKLYQIN